MLFTETRIPGAMVIDLQPHADERGFFARFFCADEFAEHGLRTDIVQGNVSFNAHRGTVRGFHYQVAPATEAKLLRCVRGAVHAVVVDMRTASPTYLRHIAIELTADSHRALYIPDMCAAGIQTLVDDTELMYHVSASYTPHAERGLHHADPRLGVEWPLPITTVSAKDEAWPLLDAEPRDRP